MTGEISRQCPNCGESFTLTPGRGRPKIYCSPPCARLISTLGGPLTAAERFEGYARDWDAVDPEFNRDHKKHAADLRASARRLRQVAG